MFNREIRQIREIFTGGNGGNREFLFSLTATFRWVWERTARRRTSISIFHAAWKIEMGSRTEGRSHTHLKVGVNEICTSGDRLHPICSFASLVATFGVNPACGFLSLAR